jgi:CheY-like chemotaxis protein
VVRAIAEMITYLQPKYDLRGAEAVSRPALLGRIILVVEEQPKVARDLQIALEEAGADVLLARSGAEALVRIEQFDVSAAVLDWRPYNPDHAMVVRQLKKEGVRLLLFASRPPKDIAPAGRVAIFAKSTPPEEIAKALAHLLGTQDARGAASLLAN